MNDMMGEDMMMGDDPMTNGMMHGEMSGNGMMTNNTMVNTDGMMNGDNTNNNNNNNNMGQDGGMNHGDMDHNDHMNHNHGDMNMNGDPTMDHGDMVHEGVTENHQHNTNTGNELEAAAASKDFCTGPGGMVMLMEGFQWVLKKDSTCINLYFPGWTLNSVGRVVAAMIGVLILGISTEAISKLRHNLSIKARTAGLAERKKLAMIQTALHGVHAFTGYILMLATMTYSLELLLCVIVGLVIGYATFGGDSYNHVTTNPCCAFLEDEAMERENPQQDNNNNNNVNNGLPRDQTAECCQSKDTLIARSEVSAESTSANGGDGEDPMFSA